MAVQVWSLIARLLSILAIAGLLTAPLAMPTSAATGDASMSEMATMSDDMPCCPHEKPVWPDCSKSCPLAVMCMGMFVPAASAFLPVRLAVADVKVPGDEIWRHLLPDPPPPKPPRA